MRAQRCAEPTSSACLPVARSLACQCMPRPLLSSRQLPPRKQPRPHEQPWPSHHQPQRKNAIRTPPTAQKGCTLPSNLRRRASASVARAECSTRASNTSARRPRRVAACRHLKRLARTHALQCRVRTRRLRRVSCIKPSRSISHAPTSFTGGRRRVARASAQPARRCATPPTEHAPQATGCVRRRARVALHTISTARRLRGSLSSCVRLASRTLTAFCARQSMGCYSARPRT